MRIPHSRVTKFRANPTTERANVTDPRKIDPEIDDRVDTWHEALDRRRRAKGLWTTDDQGEPEWLPPKHGPGKPVDPVTD